MSVEIIAEVATNHGGSVALAKEFIAEFAPYAHTIKFQLTRTAHLRITDKQFGWFERAELTIDQFAELKAECHRHGVGFLLTCYNAGDLWELKELGCNRVKIGSGESGEATLRAGVVASGLHPIVALGLGFNKHLFWPHTATFLGCCTRYPAPWDLAAVAMSHSWIHGWSDHCNGLNELKAAIAMGARMVETHVQLPKQARKYQSFEKTIHEMQALREFADDDAAERYLGRWQR